MMERNEINFDVNPDFDPRRQINSGFHPELDEEELLYLQQGENGMQHFQPQPPPRRNQSSKRPDVIVPEYHQQYQPYLRQFHALPPNVRNPEEKLPDHPHIHEVEELKKLKLHQGSVCQFPTNVRNTGEKFPDGGHIGEVEKLQQLHLHQGSVCQFPTKMRDPEEKLPDHSHLSEVETLKNVHLHQGSVCQFPTKIRDPEEKLIDGPHIQEVEELKNLHLKQGSVCQFPSKPQATKVDDYFHPPDQPLKETLPVAHVHHPDHCLPSQARAQQTYITHPGHGPTKLMVRGVPQSPPMSPGGTRRGSRGQSPAQWPPAGQNNIPRKNFHPEGGPKSFVWPPPKPHFHRSFQELPPGGANPASTWNPAAGSQLSGAFVGFAPQRKQYNWPPNDYRRNGGKYGSAYDQERTRSMLELDEVILVHEPGKVVSYRPPPWSQFYKPPYYAQS